MDPRASFEPLGSKLLGRSFEGERRGHMRFDCAPGALVCVIHQPLLQEAA